MLVCAVCMLLCGVYDCVRCISLCVEFMIVCGMYDLCDLYACVCLCMLLCMLVCGVCGVYDRA